MKPTKEQIREFYGQALQRCLDTFSQLDDKEWAKKVNGWTAKETLAHMDVPSKADINALSAKIAALSQKVDALKKAQHA